MKLPIQRMATIAMAVFSLIYSCKKDTGLNGSGSNVTTTIFGQVTNDAGQPAIGAIASAGGVSAETDANGVFMLRDVQVDKLHAFVQVKMPGYFTASRTFVPSASSVSSVRIILLSKT